MIRCYEQSFVDIDLDVEKEILYVSWKGYQTEETVKAGCKEMLSLMVKHATFYILNDNSDVKGNWDTASNWVGSIWLPEMVKAGLKKFSWVYSPSIYSHMSTLQAMKSLPFSLINIVEIFYRRELACDWLLSHKR